MRILVAGIGNIFLGDDGFGSEVVRHVPVRQDDSGVRAVDYGIGGMHLAYDLLDDWDALVLVDAVPNRGSPGALHIFEADHESHSATAALDAHSMDPAAVFASLKALGGKPPYTVVDRLRGRERRRRHRSYRGRRGRGATSHRRR